MALILYLAIMVGAIAVVTAVSVPVLFQERCTACGRRNALDVEQCTGCGARMPCGRG